MPVLELLCDHPGCAGKDHQVLATVSNIIQAQKLIDAGEVRCPVHGVRTAPIQVGSTHMPAGVPVSEPPPESTVMGPGSKERSGVHEAETRSDARPPAKSGGGRR